MQAEVGFLSGYYISHHAQIRMQQRGISKSQIERVLVYGRTIYAKGVMFCVVGRKEVAHGKKLGLQLTDCDNIHVLVEKDGTVVTAYRNCDLHAIQSRRQRRRLS